MVLIHDDDLAQLDGFLLDNLQSDVVLSHIRSLKPAVHNTRLDLSSDWNSTSADAESACQWVATLSNSIEKRRSIHGCLSFFRIWVTSLLIAPLRVGMPLPRKESFWCQASNLFHGLFTSFLKSFLIPFLFLFLFFFVPLFLFQFSILVLGLVFSFFHCLQDGQDLARRPYIKC
ncbi:hypothetical protein EI94DRAFT_1748937 [Lactarius quietus]|nr:hypothetical protein EI94DRAFT_1748937 [Lactarius quietus]